MIHSLISDIYTRLFSDFKRFSDIFKVTNSIRELNLTIVIKVPVKLGDKDIWLHTEGPQVRCFRKHED